MSGKRKVPSTEGSKQSKSKKSKVDPLQRSLLCFFQPLDDSRREDQQEELENVDGGENIDDGFGMVQQDGDDIGTQQETADTPLKTVDSNRGRNPARKRKTKRRRMRSSCLRVEASDDDDDDDDDDRYDEEEHDSDRDFLAPDDDVEEDVGVFGASRAQYVLCDRTSDSNDDHPSKSNLSQEVEDEASIPKEAPAKSKGASYVVTDVSGFDDECRKHSSKRLRDGGFEEYLRGAVRSFSVPKDVFIATFLFGVGLQPISGTQLPAASKLRPSARIPKEHSQVVKELIATFAGVRLGRIWGMVKDSAALMGVPLG